MSKTLPPTKQKLDKSREQGDVAKSYDLAVSVSALFMPIIFCLLPYIAVIIKQFLDESFVAAADISDNNMLLFASESIAITVKISIFLLVSLGLAGLLTEIAQVGILFSWKSIKLDFSRLSPSKGLRRLLGFSENENEVSGFATKLYEIFKMGLHVGGGTFLAVVISILAGLFDIGVVSTDPLLQQHVMIIVFVIGWSLFSLFLLLTGAVDLLIQKKIRVNRLGMSFEELKRELKESEGSPELKQARKESYNQLLISGILQGVRSAKVLITSRAKL